MITAIAAIGRNRELGKGNALLWHIPDDLKRLGVTRAALAPERLQAA